MYRLLIALPWLLALDTQLAGCMSCSNVGCNNGAQITLDGIEAGEVVSRGGRVQICSKDTCDVVEIDASGTRTFSAYSLGSEVSILSGSLLIHVPPYYELTVGDVYSIELWDASDASLGTFVWDATYHASYPNGQQCDEEPCLLATLDSTNHR